MESRKDEIRNEIRRRRAQCDLADFQRAGVKITRTCDVLLRRFLKPDFIMCYVSRADEAPTHNLIRLCLLRGMRVCVPVVDRQAKTLGASELANFTTDLELGFAGIYEPKEECRRPVKPNEIDVHFIPLVAFAPDGSRLGRGGGYFDRFLAECSEDKVKVGLALSWQLVREIPASEHDVLMDLIVTEQGVLEIRKGLLNN
ncbi:MAG: putative 5-formyltetrahydrofolate cyclo-ligase [candidate division BRC1 bacterium ADurb.BinA364]|nr:MAG: putative 5-formyltetrahydrofolate cyclo-ligase [candidate division BRC1 bacterium ADurb.BinA364]